MVKLNITMYHLTTSAPSTIQRATDKEATHAAF